MILVESVKTSISYLIKLKSHIITILSTSYNKFYLNLLIILLVLFNIITINNQKLFLI